MTLNDVQKAALALFAARAAGERASLEQMKAIAYVIRNRVKAGWWADWLTAMERADEAAGNLAGTPVKLDTSSRTLQRMIADVDDIYYRSAGARDQGTTARNTTAQGYATEPEGTEEALTKCLYWCFIDQPTSPWFQENVLDRPEEHPLRAQMGKMLFFE